MEVIPDTDRITAAAVMVRTDPVMPLTLAIVPIQALSRSRLEIGRTILGARGITWAAPTTLGRQATGDGVITTDIGATVTTTDGTKVRNVS